MTRNAFSKGSSMQNFTIIAPTVWAVGEGGLKNLAAHLLNGAILYSFPDILGTVFHLRSLICAKICLRNLH